MQQQQVRRHGRAGKRPQTSHAPHQLSSPHPPTPTHTPFRSRAPTHKPAHRCEGTEEAPQSAPESANALRPHSVYCSGTRRFATPVAGSGTRASAGEAYRHVTGNSCTTTGAGIRWRAKCSENLHLKPSLQPTQALTPSPRPNPPPFTPTNACKHAYALGPSRAAGLPAPAHSDTANG
jgi:hypothetical protein